jgi:tetratricopeptide (TPR) repeat protein
LRADEAGRLLALAREGELARLRSEQASLEEAVRFLAADGRDEEAAELAAGVWRLWLVSGDLAGGRRLLGAALEGGGPPSRARALALYGDGLLAFRQGAQAESRARNETARAVSDREAESLALVGLSRVALRDGDYDRVRSLAFEARELTRDREPDADVAPLHMLAAGTRLAGDADGAAELYQESLELNRRLGDSRMVGVELHNLGHVELHRGDVEAAERCFAEREAASNQDDPYEQAMTHLNQAHGDCHLAADLLGRTQATLDASGIVLDPDDAFEVDWLRARLA